MIFTGRTVVLVEVDAHKCHAFPRWGRDSHLFSHQLSRKAAMQLMGALSHVWQDLAARQRSRRNGADPRPSVNQAGHIPSCYGSCERCALSLVPAACRWSLLLLLPLLSTRRRPSASKPTRPVQGLARVRSRQAPVYVDGAGQPRPATASPPLPHPPRPLGSQTRSNPLYTNRPDPATSGDPLNSARTMRQFRRPPRPLVVRAVQPVSAALLLASRNPSLRGHPGPRRRRAWRAEWRHLSGGHAR